MVRTLAFLLLASVAVNGAYGWGAAGHSLIAEVAQSLISPNTNATVWQILNDTMGDVANWADEATHEDEWRWTKPYHYININSTHCDFEYSRDCKDSDTLQPNWCCDYAILRFTKNLQYSMMKSIVQTMALGGTHSQHVRQVSASEKVDTFDSMKFIIHFVGDIHQPLHVGFLKDFGGQYDVTFLGEETRLHQVWDYGMINYKIATSFGNDSTLYLTQLLQDIGPGGKYASEVDGWKSCTSMPYSGVACPDEWADESIQAACQYAYKGAPPGAVLGMDYYNENIGEVDMLLAKAGVRLGHTLDLVYQSALAASRKVTA